MADLTKVVTGKVLFSYLHVFTPKAMEDGGKPKYSACLIISKNDKKTLDKIKAAIRAAIAEGKEKFGSKWKMVKSPLRDGDEERDDQPEFENAYFINASGFRKTGLVDADREPILDENELYSGCFGRASVRFYPFNAKGNKGVACGLNHLQKLEDGERLGGGGSSAKDDFDDDYEDDDLFA